MISNNYIADMLEEIANLLAIRGDNHFKIRAHRMGAAKIRELTYQIDDNTTENEITKIKGIGKALAGKIIEISKTGDCPTHINLLREIPRGVLELLNIEGLGPKRIGLLYRELGIRDSQELKKAILENKVSSLEGFADKLNKKILDGIEYLKEKRGRFSLGEAVPIARELYRLMKNIKGVEEVALAGSLRRWKESVKDLDILVTGKKEHTDEVMNKFTSYHYVDKVLLRGDTKATVRLQNGLNVDLRFVDTNCFGASAQYFTGSKEHNIALRTLAKNNGFKTSEYGLFDVSGGREIKVAGASEEDFYNKLGMKYIEPELRENTGEIEAAMEDKLPELIDLSDIKGDLQMHTTKSDGKNTLEEMIEAAIALGHKFIAITEHSKAVRVANGLDEKSLLEWIETIRKVELKYPGFRVLPGIEVDILKDGSLDLDVNVLKGCDIVVASIHSSFRLPFNEMTQRLITGISNEVVNVLAHPTCRLINQRPAIEFDFTQVLQAAKKNKVAMEINAQPKRLDLKDSMVRQVINNEGFISINTDAHSTSQLELMKYGVFTARRGWCNKEYCINTFSVEKLEKFLAKN